MEVEEMFVPVVTGRDYSHIPEALAMFDGGEAETIMELVGRRDPQPPTSSANQPAPASVPTSVPMEVDTAAAPSSSGSSAAASTDQNPGEEEDELSLPRLSEQLCLDELWATLGECLSQLASTTDHHAVLVLQPAVEAFFMVHAGNISKLIILRVIGKVDHSS
jgi:E3 ubiquitin-protein ligase HUWE1